MAKKPPFAPGAQAPRRSLPLRTLLLATLTVTLAGVGVGTMWRTAANATVPATATASLTATTVALNEPVTLTGSSSHTAGGTAQLESKTPGGHWITVGEPAPLTGNQFTLPVPTGWYGTRTLRVALHAPSSLRAKETSRALHLTVIPAYDPPGDATSFTSVNPSGRLVRWDPCSGPITYRINPEGSYPGAVADVQTAFRMAAEATGLTFTYLGSSTETNSTNPSHHKDADILIQWAITETFSGFDNDDAGHAQVRYAHLPVREDSGAWVRKATSGTIWMNSDMNTEYDPGFGTPGETVYDYHHGVTLLHELAHVLGLGHVNDTRQMMYDHTLLRTPVYGAGDLAGLERVGAGSGCL